MLPNYKLIKQGDIFTSFSIFFRVFPLQNKKNNNDFYTDGTLLHT